jgi:hypothetical protein
MVSLPVNASSAKIYHTDPRVLLRRLCKRFRRVGPVNLFLEPLADHVRGLCNYDGHAFEIHLDSTMPFYCLIETLVHEFAHALCWQWYGNGTNHGPQWGVAYSEVYRAVYGP